ncbi:MAG: hypothetical protein AAGH46_05300 [Bacteroidota bacterium]
MSLDLFRLLIDFGFVILIWAVQLVIYPSFKYYSQENLVNWHQSYTKRVTVIVLPLMIIQLTIAVIQIINIMNLYTILSMILISILWFITFLVFVPLHQKIDSGEAELQTSIKLVRYNWIRTVLWSMVFVISLFQHI